MAQGSARGTRRIRAWTVAAIAAAFAAATPAAAVAAGPTAIGADDAGASYVGWASGAVKRFAAGGADLGQWPVPGGDAEGRLGPVMAIDVADSGGTPHGGNVWILDANRRVQEFTRAGAYIRGFRLDACDGSNDPDPGLEGGIDVTAGAIYVAHPCANRLFRYAIADLAATGASAPAPAATEEAGHTFAPHGIAAQTGGAAPAQTVALYVAHAPSSVVRQYDLTTLALIGEAPGGHLGGRYDDVFIDAAGNLFSNEINDGSPGNDDRIYRYDASGAEDLNFGGTGAGPGQLSDSRAFDVHPQTGEFLVADTGNERLQRFSPGGNPIWATAAADPGAFPAPPAPDPPAQPAPDPGAGGGQLPAGGGSAGAPGAPGVTIEDDARYTNSPYVDLTVREPAGTTAVEISNSAAFGDKDARALQASLAYEWTLDEGGSDLTPRTVFVRFPGSGSDRVYSDEIILDRREPIVGAATLARKGKGKRGRKGRRFVLRVVAEDEVSGLDELQLARTEDGRYKPRNFKGRTVLKRAKRARWVRVADFAGNVTDPVKVERGKR